MKLNTPQIIASAVRSLAATRDLAPATPTYAAAPAAGPQAAIFETLEARRMLAASVVTYGHGHLTVAGDSNQNNDLRVELSGDGETVRGVANGKPGNWVKADWVKKIVIHGGGQADLIRLDSRLSIPSVVQAYSGDDEIHTAKGKDSIVGGGGQDTIYAGDGDDRIEGGDGNDYIDTGPGRDKAVGDAGNDTLVGDAGDWLTGGSGKDTYLAPDGSMTKAPAGAASKPAVKAPSFTPPAVSASQVTFTLINADTDQPVPGHLNLSDGETIDLSTLPKRLNIRANVPASFAGSVRLAGAGKVIMENSAPYALFGDAGNNYHAGTINPGTVHLTADVFTARNGGGSALGSKAVTLKFHNGATGAVPASKPPTVPVNVPTVPTVPSVGNVFGTGNPNGPAPDANIAALSTSVPLGTAVHVHGLVSQVREGGVEDAHFAWDFGDGGHFSRVEGFNAAHLYDKPGTYQVSLKLTNAAGKSDTSTINVTVTAADRAQLFVSTKGNDANDGRSPGRPVRSMGRVRDLASKQNDVEVLFARGERFDIDSGLTVYGRNVVVRAYGSGDRPVINWVGKLDASTIFGVGGNARDVTVRDLTITSKYGGSEQAGMPYATQIDGQNVSVVGIEFLNVGYAVNANGMPNGALVQDNTAPSETGVRGYFVWTAGTDFVIQGNSVANSTREHVVRMSRAERVAVVYNDFANLDRRSKGDLYDVRKGVIVAQVGKYAYITGNRVDGPLAVGPLGEKDGLGTKSARFEHAVVSVNDVRNWQIEIKHGAEHVTVRDNFVAHHGGPAIQVQGYDGTFGRGVIDVVIDHNTVSNASERGQFLQVLGKVDGILLTDNLFSSPKLMPGSYSAAGVYVAGSDLSSFTAIRGNVWPSGVNGAQYAQGGVHYVGWNVGAAGYLDPAEWKSDKRVSGSIFRDVTLTNGAYNAVVDGALKGARMAA